MKKIISFIGILLLTSSIAHSQVGINTENPRATLDVTAAETTGKTIEGIIAPRLTRTQLISKDALYTIDQAGTILYISDISGTATTKTSKITKVGYYYFDGASWQPFTAASGGADNTWVKNNPSKIISLGVQSDNTTARTAGTEFAINDNGNVGIGTATPTSSAILDLTSANKGFLTPRVALQSVTDVTTIASPSTGLLVYNLGTAGLAYKGYAYWDGFKWLSLNNLSLSPGSLGSITCNSVSCTPNTYTTTQEYKGTMLVPYTGGDGGTYTESIIGPVNGLTATLAPGNFSMGSGSLAYTITGTPTQSSPTVTVFPLTIGGQSCNATIGGGTVIAPGELTFYAGSFLASKIPDAKVPGSEFMSHYVNDLPVIAGKLRLDVRIYSSSNVGNGGNTINPVAVNITDKPIKVWFSAITTVDKFNAANYVIAAGGVLELDNSIYHNLGFDDVIRADGMVISGAGYDGSNLPTYPATFIPASPANLKGKGRDTGYGTNANQEVITVDLDLDGKWYRIYYFPVVDNMNTVDDADNLRRIYISTQRLY